MHRFEQTTMHSASSHLVLKLLVTYINLFNVLTAFRSMFAFHLYSTPLNELRHNNQGQFGFCTLSYMKMAFGS